MKTITMPFAFLMRWLYTTFGNYGVTVILFAFVINFVLAPFMGKSKKSMMRTSRIQPQIQEIQRRHQANPQKMNEEMQRLYREEGINPMSGCIWSLIPFPILIALYSVIRQPLTRMMYVGEEVVNAVRDFVVANGLYTLPAKADAYAEIKIVNAAHSCFDALSSHLQGLNLGSEMGHFMDLDFGFLGMNLGDVPWDKFKILFDGGEFKAAYIGLILIPLVSAGLSWLSMKVSQQGNPQSDAQTQASMQSMSLMMPIMSIWICFIMPAALGIYWIANSVFGMGRDIIFTKIFKKQLEKEDAERIAARSAREREIELKHLETERLREEGKTTVNTNTSKKKLQANEKQKSDERKAALDKAERAARRERLGIKENEIPASQVGNRRYARGRAYVPDRFTNPEGAEAATIAAAAESEFGSSIDESFVEETVTETVTAVEETAEAVEEAVEEAKTEE